MTGNGTSPLVELDKVAPAAPATPNREQRRAFVKRQRRQIRLRFEDDSVGLKGLVVLMSSISVGQMMDLVELNGVAFDSAEMTAEAMSAVGRLFAMLGEAMAEWNLTEDDGTPVPADVAGVRSLDFDQAMELIRQWMDAAAGVTAPLAPSSPAGKPSDLSRVPMDPTSPELWPAPS